MIVFLLLRMGLSKNALRERERERGLRCTKTRGEAREVTCAQGGFVKKCFEGERDRGL